MTKARPPPRGVLGTCLTGIFLSFGTISSSGTSNIDGSSNGNPGGIMGIEKSLFEAEKLNDESSVGPSACLTGISLPLAPPSPTLLFNAIPPSRPVLPPRRRDSSSMLSSPSVWRNFFCHRFWNSWRVRFWMSRPCSERLSSEVRSGEGGLRLRVERGRLGIRRGDWAGDSEGSRCAA